jgi:hypothetical protein
MGQNKKGLSARLRSNTATRSDGQPESLGQAPSAVGASGASSNATSRPNSLRDRQKIDVLAHAARGADEE